jgi:hypothetical protein
MCIFFEIDVKIVFFPYILLICAFFVAIAHLPHIRFCLSRSEPIDGAPFVVGVLTLLKQFHASYTDQFLSFLGQVRHPSINWLIDFYEYHSFFLSSLTVLLTCSSLVGRCPSI